MDPVKEAIILEANKRYEARATGAMLIDRIDPEWLTGNLFNPSNIPNLVIRGMRGLGDNINQRAFIKELGLPVFLDTPWPELYEDIPGIRFVPCSTPLRTQLKNLSRQNPTRFVEAPKKDFSELKVQYGSRDLQRGSMYEALSRIFGGIKPKSFSLPQFKFPSDKIKKFPKIAVIRPATVRREWAAISRNPDPRYLKEASQVLLEMGYYIISVADLVDGHEWLLEPRPLAQLELHHGELNVVELLGLCRGADVLIGGHGWLTHVSLAEKIPMLCVMGGFGGDNRPETVADPLFMDVSSVNFVVPDNFCKCTVMAHQLCDKTISDFEQKTIRWIEGLK